MFSNVTARILSKSGPILPFCYRYARRCLSHTVGKVSFTKRTHTCGELRHHDAGQQVTLCGWLQYQRMRGMFLVLRDWDGITQVVLPENKLPDLVLEISDLAYESVVTCSGTVQARPPGQENQNMATGAVEVLVDDIQVLNKCTTQLPFEIREFHRVRESLRMEYRYLDIRSQMMQRNLRLRSKMVMKMREFLCNMHDFVDVETPTLFRRTPGGAKEFIVPTRIPGKFYSLPQSPQQFKQLLMIGGIDRYFQIARCYRDEGSKPDRQPEFTQVDLEMSFVSQEDVISLVEQLLQYSWPEDQVALSWPFPRLSYEQVMKDYGTDKPDTRFEMRLQDVTTILCSSGVKVFEEALGIQALRIPDGAKHFSNSEIDKLQDILVEMDRKNLTVVRVGLEGQWKSVISKHINAQSRETVMSAVGALPGDLIFFASGQDFNPHMALGKIRLECANRLEHKGVKVRSQEKFSFLWIQDFPLFLPKEDGDGLESAHHPFTAAHPDDEGILYTYPNKVRSQHYDLVLNGNEIGGGSIRIHDARQQRYILETVLKEEPGQLEHLLQALDSGCPPHGGIALGLDRLLAIICGSESIRDVIAFPKTHDGKDPMSKAPASVPTEDLDLYNIQIKH